MISKKIVLLGFYGVGKTSLISQYVHKKFSDRYLTTIGVSVERKVVQIDGKSLTMIIWDVAGESGIDKILGAYLKGSHGSLYVFDLTRSETFENIKSELELAREAMGGDVPIKVIGNKADLMMPDEIEMIRHNLPVKIDFITSAKDSLNVEEAFESLGRDMISYVV